MNKTLRVVREEFIRVVFRKSFLITLVLVPLVPFFMHLITNASNIEQPSMDPVSEILSGSNETQVEGFVDESGLILQIPVEFENQLIQFEDLESARQAQQAGQITAYYRIQSDFVENGRIDYYREDYNPIRGLIRSTPIQQVLLYNLTEGDKVLYQRLSAPVELDSRFLRDTSSRELNPDNMGSFLLPYIIAMVFYIVIIGSSTLMLNAISVEKENRVMEILLSSASPGQIIIGKMIALGLVGLFQTVVWGVLGVLIFSLGGERFNVPPEFLNVPLSLLLWAVVFFVLGYMVYAGMMSGMGTLIPGTREASQVSILISLPLILPLFLITALARSPNGWLSMGLSLFPLTAPIAMIMRLSIADVPLWQILLSAALLLVTGILVLRFTSGFFRAQNLLSGQKFHLKTFLRALIGKA